MARRCPAPAAAPALRAPAATLSLGLFLLLPLACNGQVCDNPVARGGKSKFWPMPNPMMVAPVNVTFNYEAYVHPMLAEFTGTDLNVRVPPDFKAGFNMTNPANGTFELYTLRSMQLRKPGKVPEGGKQVLSHIFEVAMIHEETTGTGYWANVVVPFEVGEDAVSDFLTQLVADAKLPSEKGEIQPVLVSDARPLKLNQVWKGASFYHSWATLPTGCQGVMANTRQLMRNSTLMVSVHTFHRLLDALHLAPEVAPEAAPKLVWELVGCQDGAAQGSCAAPAAQNLQGKLTEAQKVQSSTLGNMRSCKDTMDQILVQIKNNSLPSLMSAIAARDNLRDAQAQFDSASRNVDELQKWIWQAGNATWDADAPQSGLSKTSAKSLLQAAASMAFPRRSNLLAESRPEREAPVLNLLYGSGRPLLRHRASQQLHA